MRGEAILFSNGERHETRQNGRWKDWALRAVAQGSLRDRYREQLGRLLPRPAVKRSPQRRTERRPSLVAPGKPLGPLALAPEEAAKYRAAKSGSSGPGLAALTSGPPAASVADPIIAIEITDIETFEEQDPTGRRAMERQFMPPPESNSPRGSMATETAQVIDFSSIRGDSSRR